MSLPVVAQANGEAILVRTVDLFGIYPGNKH